MRQAGPNSGTPSERGPRDRDSSGQVKKWGLIIGIVILVALGIWCGSWLASDYESSPAGKGKEIEHEAYETCKGIEYTVVDVIKQTLADPDSFAWRDGHRVPSRDDLVMGDIGAGQIAPFVAHFRHKNQYGAYELDQRRGTIEVDECVVSMPRYQ